MIAMTCFAALFGAAFLICYATLLDAKRDLARATELAWRNANEVEKLRGRVLPAVTVFDQMTDEQWSA